MHCWGRWRGRLPWVAEWWLVLLLLRRIMLLRCWVSRLLLCRHHLVANAAAVPDVMLGIRLRCALLLLLRWQVLPRIPTLIAMAMRILSSVAARPPIIVATAAAVVAPPVVSTIVASIPAAASRTNAFAIASATFAPSAGSAPTPALASTASLFIAATVLLALG